MSGSQDITEDVARRLQKNYARFFGFEVVEARPGAVTLALDHREEFEHAPGWFEGAITGAAGMIAASYSGATLSQPDWSHAVLDQQTRFVGAARGDRLVAVGRVTTSGKSISFTGADVFVERSGERHLCAQVTLTMRHTPPRD